MNLGTVTVTKKWMIRIPDGVVEKLKLNIKIDAVSFIWEDEEVKLKVLRG